MNILVVDDDVAVAQLIEKRIEKWGHAVEKASNGKEALNKFRQNRFDLVLIDIFLPDMRGNELIPEFKQIWPDIRIITMTGHNTRELEAEIRGQGIVYYMIKPFETKVLKSLVDHISNKRIQQKSGLGQ